jgi:hypothetical protein
MADPATRENAKQKLMELGAVISTAAMLLTPYKPLIEQYRREREHMDAFGPIIDPTLWKNPERQAVDAFMGPLYEAALLFVLTYEKQIAKAAGALATVQESEEGAHG